MRFGFRVCVPDAGIEEDQPVVVLRQIGKDGFDSWLRAACFRACSLSTVRFIGRGWTVPDGV